MSHYLEKGLLNKTDKLLFILLIRQQQIRFKHVKSVLSKQIKGWQMESFYSVLHR